MKNRTPEHPPTIIDQNYISSIFDNLQDSISKLDHLNKQYQVKKQEQLLHTYMKVIEKIGGELIMAQEAYKNVDMQVKKDDYCLGLAQELRFFKEESINLKQMLEKTTKELAMAREQKYALDAQLRNMKRLLQKKAKQCLEYKIQMKQLKNHLKRTVYTSQQNSKQNVNLSIKLQPYHNKSCIAETLRDKLQQTAPNLDFHNSRTSEKKQNSVFVESSIYSTRTGHSVTLSPMVKSPRKEISPYFYDTRLSIRSKKTSKGDHRILPETYNPQTNL